MHRDLVERRRWISEERFLNALNYCMLLPGPEAQQLAIYIGWLLHGIRGGLVAGAFFILPSVAILWGLSAAYAAFGTIPLVAGVLSGLKPVVVALVLAAVVRIGRKAFRPRGLAGIAAGAFAGLFFFHVPFPAIVLGAALIGAAASRIWPRAFETASGPTRKSALGRPRAIRTRRRRRARPHGRARSRSSARVCCSGPRRSESSRCMFGGASLFSAEYFFFSKAALVTFGGAYAVLAYVTQVAVESFHWISHAQAVDGLALAETTPGPLIMVLQFVGYMAGWNHPVTANRLASATVGALVTTWVTFLPCFVFVFLGAPHVEALRTRAHPAVNGALKAVTAAVVGIILNLGVVFGMTVLFPRGLQSGLGIDPFSAILTAAALFVLLRSRVDPIWVVLSGAAAGLLVALVGG